MTGREIVRQYTLDDMPGDPLERLREQIDKAIADARPSRETMVNVDRGRDLIGIHIPLSDLLKCGREPRALYEMVRLVIEDMIKAANL